MRPTPETDAAEDRHGNGNALHAHCHDSSHLNGDFADFARNLERQRDEAVAKLKAEGEARAMFARLHAEAIKAGKEAERQRDELLEALEKQASLTAYYNGHSDGYKPHPNGGVFWENYLCTEARAAIAEVKGGKL